MKQRTTKLDINTFMGLRYYQWMLSWIRKEDKRELETSSGLPVDKALRIAIAASQECWYTYEKASGIPAAIFGLMRSPVFKDAGIPWMVGSNLIRLHARVLMKMSKHIIDQWLTKYNVLQNCVDSRNEVHVAWLKHMGFTFDGQFDISGVPFLYFYKETNHV